MNPKPFSLLNHFTVPCAIAVLLQESRVARAHRVRGVVFADDGSRRSWKATNATATNPASRIQPNKELLTTNYHPNRLSAAPRAVPWRPSMAGPVAGRTGTVNHALLVVRREVHRGSPSGCRW